MAADAFQERLPPVDIESVFPKLVVRQVRRRRLPFWLVQKIHAAVKASVHREVATDRRNVRIVEISLLGAIRKQERLKGEAA